ncbi:ribosomal protein L4/L1 family-domain-containing protein [Naematelia encephala]|uniref:Large ribosomal subunit protein uL4m n=1 Tax=Naematelia encephala TaxID=71784 RepID=A0A1Y2AX61_9TREE|nr:ribosomal protein L4/L1 family-domain-containing protein [Naematelia encephala]
MRRAARIIPTIHQSVRAPSAVLRPTFLSTCIPGPSRLPLRHVATSNTTLLQQTTRKALPSIPNSEPTDTAFSPEEDIQFDENDLPDNVTLEDIEREIDRGLEDRGSRLHTLPTDFDAPILLPISSLISQNPTQASPSNVVVELPRDIFAQPLRKDILHRCVVWYQAGLRYGTKKTKGRSEVAYSGRKLRPQKGSGKARLADRSNPMLKGGAHAHPIQPRDWSQLLPRKVRALGMRIALSSKLDMGMLRVVKSFNEGGWNKTKQAFKALTDKKITRRDTQTAAGQIALDQGVADEPEASAETEANAVDGQQAAAENSASTSAESQVVETQIDAESSSTDLVADDEFEQSPEVVEYIRRFGKSKKDLSVLFLHAPSKPDIEVWNFGRVIRNIPGIDMLSTDEVQVYHVLKYRWLVVEGDAIDALEKRFTSKPERIVRIGTERETRASADGSVRVPQPELPQGLPKGWAIRGWRKAVGAKRIEKALGHRRARDIAKKAKKEDRRAKRRKVWEERTNKWQRTLTSMEYQALYSGDAEGTE